MNTILRTVCSVVKPLQQSASYHLLRQAPATRLLPATSTSLVPNCGFKVKGVLKKRCKDCYFVRREDRLFVICNTHPRHKQMQMVKKEKNTWILTHATQGKIRSW